MARQCLGERFRRCLLGRSAVSKNRRFLCYYFIPTLHIPLPWGPVCFCIHFDFGRPGVVPTTSTWGVATCEEYKLGLLAGEHGANFEGTEGSAAGKVGGHLAEGARRDITHSSWKRLLSTCIVDCGPSKGVPTMEFVRSSQNIWLTETCTARATRESGRRMSALQIALCLSIYIYTDILLSTWIDSILNNYNRNN